MGTSLIGLLPQNTYSGLIKVGNNTALNTTLKQLSDGAGNDLPMQASTTGVNFTGTVAGVASGVSGAIQFSNGSAFASDASNLFWDNTNKRLGVGTNTPDTTAHFKGGVTGAVGTRIATFEGSLPEILFKDTFNNTGFAIAKYGGIVYFVNTNSSGAYSSYSGLINSQGQWSFGGGFNPSGTVHIKGSGSTSATTSLLVQNSGGTKLFQVTDDGAVDISGYTFVSASVIQNTTMRLVPTTGGVAINTSYSNANASAILDVSSTTKGFLPPRMTTTQKNAISTPATGLVVYDSTMNATCEYNGTAWRVVSAGAQSVAASTATTTVDMSAGNVQNITLTASTTLTLSSAAVGTYILKLIQGGSGSYTVTWPASVIWSGGTAPTLTTTVGKVDIITLVYDGTNYYGNYSLNY